MNMEDFDPDDEDRQITVDELLEIDLEELEAGESLWITDNYFPDTRIFHEGGQLVAEISEHIYTKFWTHKYHAQVFAGALVRAVKRLAAEGHPVANPTVENEDEPHFWIRWQVRQSVYSSAKLVVDSIRAAEEIIWERANSILDHSDSVLLLGKDTGESLQVLKDIKTALEEIGYFVYIIKEQPDKVGESIIQKVLRYALSSKFILIENTEPSGHLYEIPHVVKMAECITALLQLDGKGATWMFEDIYAKTQNFKKFVYREGEMSEAIREAADWAEAFSRDFSTYQKRVLPWMKKP